MTATSQIPMPRPVINSDHPWTLTHAHSRTDCLVCGHPVVPGDAILWRPGQVIHHEPCATIIARPSVPDQPATIDPFANVAQTEAERVTLADGTYSVKVNGQYFTFRIERPQQGALAGRVVLSFLHGVDPGNDKHYTGFAFINNDSSVYIWKKFQTHDLINVLRFCAVSILQGCYVGGPNDR